MKLSRLAALALCCGALSLSSSAFAAPEGDGARAGRIERFCAKAGNSERAERRLARIAERLHLTDAQKELFKAVQDARAPARKAAIDTVCAGKLDLHDFAGKLAFRQALLEARLNGMKASSAKLVAFYDALDNGQKALFDDMRGHRHWGREHGWGDHRRWRDD